MTAADLPPFPVGVPLAMAALLLGTSKLLPGRTPDLLAIGTALVTAGLCAAMAVASVGEPITYWFGGWQTDGPQVIGIAFHVDEASAAFAALIALLFAATFVFSWGFFEDTHAHFHVLMLAFMAGMVGFCFASDLFNLFVWFELMSVAGFAATGYELRPAAIAGALNFTVLNTIGSYLFLAGLALVYAEVGALDFGALGQGVAAHPGDPVTVGAFALLATGLLIKAAQVPFQMWLGDAHAVAPSPVSVIFSGAMVAIGLFGLAKLVWVVFVGSPPVMHLVETLLLGMGVASALVGGAMALTQRHIKRMLAFSTISHVGIMLTALAMLRRDGTAGMLAYIGGHGLVKASMFMVAGAIAAWCGGIDELEQRGRGKAFWPLGVVMAFGGLLLAGLPIGPMDEGVQLLGAAAAQSGRGWVEYALAAGAALTGAAVLRAAGRVFAGWGEVPGDEARSKSEQETEHLGRPWYLVAFPPVLLLLLGAVPWDDSGTIAARAASGLMRAQQAGAPALSGSALSWAAVGVAVLIASYQLGRNLLPRGLTGPLDTIPGKALDVLKLMHSGLVGDYVAWLVVGLALFAGVALLG